MEALSLDEYLSLGVAGMHVPDLSLYTLAAFGELRNGPCRNSDPAQPLLAARLTATIPT